MDGRLLTLTRIYGELRRRNTVKAQTANMAEPLELKIQCAAHHESGHIVVAAVQGLRLRPEGLMVDFLGEGLACYCREVDGSDALRERVLTATFAGYYAEKQFREQRGYAVLDLEYWSYWSFDGGEARQLLSEISLENLTNGNVPATRTKLQAESKRLVERHWAAIEALAGVLLAKEWEYWKPLKSGASLSAATTAKYVRGQEVVDVLAQHGISAICDPHC